MWGSSRSVGWKAPSYYREKEIFAFTSTGSADRGGGWFMSRKMLNTCGIYSITESQKVGNDSPNFPRVCIQLRASATSTAG